MYPSKNNAPDMPIIKLLAIAFAIQLAGNLHAETTSQVLCFTKPESSDRHALITLKIKYYFDEEMQRQIGALAKYNASPNAINLVPTEGYTSDETVDYELHWLEIVKGQITGEYVLYKPKNATILAAYIKYKKVSNKQTTTFAPHVTDDCQFNTTQR